MPSCISFAPCPCEWTRLKALHRQSLLGGLGKFREIGFHVLADVNAQRATPALRQNSKIPAGLCGFHYTKSVFLSRHRQIDFVIASNLQENSARRPTLVRLTRGM